MRVKKILSDVRLVVAEIEVSLNGKTHSKPTLCAIVKKENESAELTIPLNTPDGRPILMNWDNAIVAPK
jgi:hypothetical protein